MKQFKRIYKRIREYNEIRVKNTKQNWFNEQISRYFKLRK